jgi:hypothetical protein
MRTALLDKLVWTLIYGGLIVVCLGLFVRRAEPLFGWAMIGSGAVVAVIGAVLIYVRSLRAPPSA